MSTYEDFIGFSFEPYGESLVHSSDLNILRVSDGSRYGINLLPTMKEQTADIPGGDGTYWWNTTYTQLQFGINIAFDSLSEYNIRRIKQVFNGKKMGKLIFDETPYKYWAVKVTGTPTLRFVSFNENGNRVYKGEGTINFIAYFPYAISTIKYLEEAVGDRFANQNEWVDSLGLKQSISSTGISGSSFDLMDSSHRIYVYNPGDLEVYPRFYFGSSESVSSSNFPTQLQLGDKILVINWNLLTPSENFICIDCTTHLINGCELIDGNYVKTSNLYNLCITQGDFFSIPVSDQVQQINVSISNNVTGKAEYNYLYL